MTEDEKGRPEKTPDEERFFAKVDKTNSCWIWTGSHTTDGYGGFYAYGKKIRAHRWSYEFHKSPIPDGLSVCHACDVPACVNPSHLWLGTARDNAIDMVRKNRQGPSRTHCRKGHAYKEVGCYYRTKQAGGRQAGTLWRNCKKCETDARRRRANKKKNETGVGGQTDKATDF